MWSSWQILSWYYAKKKKQIRHSTHQVAEFAVVWIIFSRQSWLKVMPTESLTEAITYLPLQNSC